MEITLAAYGWRHEHWMGSYYPDDLPAEWYFDYYCNEFRAVLLPQGEWSRAADEELQAWLDESGDDFRFYLDYSHRGDRERAELCRVVEHLRPKLGGIHHPSWNASEVKALSSLAEAIGGGVPICLGMGTPPFPTELPAGVTVCSELTGDWVCEGGGLCIFPLDSTEDQRQLRREIEKLLHEGGCHTLLLVCDDIATMQTARIIVELLGLG
jgi:hypothetical protein